MNYKDNYCSKWDSFCIADPKLHLSQLFRETQNNPAYRQATFEVSFYLSNNMHNGDFFS
jgi:hypothetical protein